jgi:hypothetical protein
MSTLAILPFALLLLAVLGLWVDRLVWMGALVAAVAAAYYTGALQGLAALWIFIVAALCAFYAWARARASTPGGRVIQAIAALLLFSYALVMAVAPALLGGFVRIELVPAQVLSPGAAPYAVAVGFPKVVTGILILGIVNPALLARQQLGRTLALAAPVLLVTFVATALCALALGYTAFAPKWHELFLLWAPVNLFFTCLSEEAFFRGFIQHELARVRSRSTRVAVGALVVAAVLFGLAHFGGGGAYVFAGIIAGLGYGWAFLRTQRIEAAMAVHFGVNALHFLLFVYPRLA